MVRIIFGLCSSEQRVESRGSLSEYLNSESLTKVNKSLIPLLTVT